MTGQQTRVEAGAGIAKSRAVGEKARRVVSRTIEKSFPIGITPVPDPSWKPVRIERTTFPQSEFWDTEWLAETMARHTPPPALYIDPPWTPEEEEAFREKMATTSWDKIRELDKKYDYKG